jgi:hypothetical protein
MRNKLFIVLLTAFFLPLMSCVNEPLPPSSAKEIIIEISREWSCHEDGDGIGLDFNAVITSDTSDDTKIYIANFHNMGNTDKIYAFVSTDLSITIPEQTVNNQVFSGSGDVSNDYTQITFSYTLENDNGSVLITATYSYGVTT